MSEITYEEDGPDITKVFLDGKRVGRIVRLGPIEYQYRTNSGHAGELFSTRREVMESLEEEQQ